MGERLLKARIHRGMPHRVVSQQRRDLLFYQNREHSAPRIVLQDETTEVNYEKSFNWNVSGSVLFCAPNVDPAENGNRYLNE